MITKFRKKRVTKPKKVGKTGILIRVKMLVHVHPEQMRPYPTIQNLPPYNIARQLVENACTADLRWMDGVEAVELVRTSVVKCYGKRIRGTEAACGDKK